MRKTCIIFMLLVHGLGIVENDTISMRLIGNVTLDILNTTITTIHGTCADCLCKLGVNSTFFGLTCFVSNRTCQLFSIVDQNKPYRLIGSSSASLYLLSLPTYGAVQSSTLLVTGEYLWPFDSTFQDTSTTFIGTPVNNPTFSNMTINGYGFSLSLTSSMSQSVSFSQPTLKLFNQSWTFEMWIYIYDLNALQDFPMVAQCQSLEPGQYLHLLVRDATLYFGFYFDDLRGVTNLTASRWHHTAFVFDCDTHNQSVYLDGVLDASRQSTGCYQGVNGSVNIGTNFVTTNDRYFNGLMDQFYFVNRSKTSDEILRDATLTAYFSFDGNSIRDQGPLSINASLGGNTTFVAGRRAEALQILDVPDSYLTVQGLVLLGRNDQSYSFSIWINPTVLRKSSIVHLSSLPNGTGWCMPMIGLSNTSRLITASWSGSFVQVTGPVVPANTWTHVVTTYSLPNGLRLYVNGTLWNASAPFSFQASGTQNYLYVGNPQVDINCGSLPEMSGKYAGAIDEFRVYSRELSAGDILALANP